MRKILLLVPAPIRSAGAKTVVLVNTIIISTAIGLTRPKARVRRLIAFAAKATEARIAKWPCVDQVAQMEADVLTLMFALVPMDLLAPGAKQHSVIRGAKMVAAALPLLNVNVPQELPEHFVKNTHAALNAQMGVCALVTTSARVHMGTVDPIVKTKRALCVAKMVEFAQCQIISANAEMDTTEQDAIKNYVNVTFPFGNHTVIHTKKLLTFSTMPFAKMAKFARKRDRVTKQSTERCIEQHTNVLLMWSEKK